MAPLEILYAIEERSGKQPTVTDVHLILQKFEKEGAVVSERVPMEYLKKPPKRAKSSGFALAFRSKDDSNYKPRKPKWLPKKGKKGKDVVDGVTV